MSYEDCGFKPGKIYGPEKCARQCSDCDGDHHFYIGGRSGCEDDDDEMPVLPDGLDPEMYFVCKHCETYAEAVDEVVEENVYDETD